MFMKHYAPNRCLYIKVAKLRTGMGSADMSHLKNCSLKIYLKKARGVGLGGQDGCERRIKVFVKIQKKNSCFFLFFFWGGGVRGEGGGLWGLMANGGCERRIEVFVKIQKKNGGGGVGGVWVGGGGGSGWCVGGGGSGWM